MKLHLPNTLRKALLAVLAGTTYYSTAEAGCMHAGVSPTIYTDFGQNMGRYSVYQVNELLSTITRENGILIPYTTGAESGRLPQDKMISFEGMNNDGAFTAVGYNYTATVAHNGCPNPSFTPRYLGDSQAIHYQGVEYRSSENKAFVLQPSIDYKLTRSSKIFTDITASGVFDVSEYIRNGGDVKNLIHYRAGAGSQDQADFEGNTHSVAGGYAYITGGICETIGFSYQGTSESYPQAYDPFNPEAGPFDNRDVIDDPYTIHVVGIRDYGPNGVGQPTAENPKANLLPFVSRGGDSGSPVWAWNDQTQEYELIACHQARGGDNSYSRGASTWTIETMESFNKGVDMDAAGHIVHLHGAVHNADLSKTIRDATNGVETTTQYGYISGDGDFETVYFCGVGSDLETQETVYTWLSLADQKDVQNWFSYGNTYFNANGNGAGKQMHLGDLFNTENIVFSASGDELNNIYLDGDVDTGIGYVQFTPGEGATEGQNVKFYLLSDGSVADGKDGAARNYMLNSAGYIVDKGAELHIQVTNTQWDAAHNDYYYREWRKQGAGDMYIEGTGNNEIFLNLGGKGTTYLKETNGYAAYNVLINNGATVNFGGDIKQIARDVTFGNGGGYLEFSGMGDFTWESGANSHVSQDGFTINALTQDATLINSEGTATLHYVAPGETTFLGSFQDTENSSLSVIYEGGGTWTLHSIHTKLQNAGSKFTVKNGTVELVGTNTVHALGSIEGKANTRYSHPDDWHYADSTMDVTVKENATFRLGSHARLTGDVNVQSGGTLEIAEGVKHQYEYIEGWLIAEDTTSDFYRAFYGLKGDVTLAENSTLRFKFSSGTDAENVYEHNISGNGNVDMQLGGSGATLVLSGTNDFTGTKHLAGGGLIATKEAALGANNDNKWLVNEDAFIAVKDIDGNTALTYIDAASTGVIALTQNQTQQVDLRNHENMFVGALEGQVIQYGTAPTTVGSRTVYTEDALNTVTLNGNKYWQLGGGGGELVVNFLLDDPDSQLVLGNEYTTGTVTLTNAWNRIGSIFFAGKVTLNYTSEEALGGSKISLDYTNRVAGSSSVVKLLTRHSSGAMMLDGMKNTNVDLTDHKELFLGAEDTVDYHGTITPDGGAYRFGGITGTLILNNALVNQADEATNLIVDAQTYSGGTLALAEQATITGDVIVMGCDTTRPGVSGGDIALRLDVNNAIASARSVTLKEGGILDINGTDQVLNKFNMEAGSLLTDTSADWSGTVILNVAANETSELRGGVVVNTMIKNGEGSLLLAGDNAYGTLLINNGTVELQNGNSLSANGVTMVEDNGILNLAGGFDVTGAVAFSGGKALVTNKSLNGSIMVGTDGDGKPQTGTLEQVSANLSTRINSAVEVAQGSTLNLKGSNGTFVLTSTDINESGGTIALEGVHYLTFDKGGEDAVNVGGTISIKGSETDSNRPSLYSNGSSNNMTRNINHLHIDGGYAAVDEASWNTVWNIHKLTGNGNLLWNSHCDHWYSSRMVLDGENSFSGQFIARRTGGDNANRKYETYVQLDHDLALQSADVTIDGKSANNYMSLAINTDNATMKSLSGNQYAVLYAGAANPGTDQEHEQAGERPLNVQPVSTRSATITITGDQDAAFAGVVAGGAPTEAVPNPGLSIVKNGAGDQIFSGAGVTFNDVTVNSGTLGLSGANAVINGNVTIEAGAILEVDAGWTLGAGKTLNISSSVSPLAGEQAILSGNLTLSEGSFMNLGAYTLVSGDSLTMNNAGLVFSGLVMGSASPTLMLDSIVDNTSVVTINFSDSSAIQAGTEYYLASGDWSNVTITDGSGNLGYLKATFEKRDAGLYVNFDMVGDSHIWNGTSESHVWDATHFGQQGGVPGTSGIAVFSDAAVNKEVNIAATSSVETIQIDSTGPYLFHSKNDSVVTTGTLLKSGSGIAILDDASVVVGTADKKGSVEINGGELVVKSAATLAKANSISGEGMLGIGFQNAQESSIFHNGDHLGGLHITDGSYTTAAGNYYDEVRLSANATYTLGADKALAGNVVVNGQNATIDLANHKISAKTVELNSGLTLKGNGAASELNASVVGNGQTVNAVGTLSINNANFDAALDVADSAKVILKNGAYGNIDSITLGNAATLHVELGAGISNGVTINMGNNARLQMVNGNGINQVNANIVMNGNDAVITGSYSGNGSYLEGSITGQGILHLSQEGGHANSWRLDSIIADAQAATPLALDINSNVTLTAANTYTGGTTITGSTVQVNNQNTLGTGGVKVTGGTLKLNSNLNVAYLDGTVNGTVQFNNKTLVLTEDGGPVRQFGGAFSGVGSILKQGSGLQAFSQTVQLNDLVVNGGSLQLSGGSVAGRISVASGAGLYVKDNNLTISSAVENAGIVSFSSTRTPKLILDPAGNFEQKSLGYIDIEGGTESGNGFAQGTSIQVFHNQDGAKVQNIATVEYLGDTLQLDAVSGVATMGSSNTVYSVRKDMVTYDSSFTSHEAASNIQTFSLMSESSSAPATLQLNQNLAAGVNILSAGLGGKVGIGNSVVLEQSQLDAQVRTTLIGSGTYALNQGSWKLPSNVVLGDKDNWTGIVRVSKFADNGVNFANLANANSWVEVNGMTAGYLAPWDGGTLSTNLILTDHPDVGFAMYMNNGSGREVHPVMTVSGKWKGDGTLRNGNTGQTLNLDLKFTGDISGWTGKYEQMGSSSVLSFANRGGMEVNASFAKSGKGVYSLEVINDTTFSGTIVDAQLFTVKDGAKATLAGADKVMDNIAIEENAVLSNKVYTYLGGTVSNAGSISNSGILEYGYSLAGVNNVTNLNGGNIIVNTLLTQGHIDNSGTITLSSLMQGEDGVYVDANDKSGKANPNNNGFATSSFQVLSQKDLITNRDGGKIMYCGEDVTSQVMNDGWVRTAANYGTYNINSTDDSVFFSKIYAKSGGALEYIMFAGDSTSLKVDNYSSGGQTAYLHTSQVFDVGEATLEMQDGATLVVDASTTATVTAVAGGTLNLMLDGTTPETHMQMTGLTPNGATVNVSGSGVLDLGNAQKNMRALNITGATVLSSYSGGSGGGGFAAGVEVAIGNGGTLQLSAVDSFGWSGSVTKSISLLGDVNAPAALELGSRQTVANTSISMGGNSVILAMSGHATGTNAPMLDALNNNALITATGTENIVAVPLRMRANYTFNVVNAGDELILAGGTAEGFRNNYVVKNGNGKLIFDVLQANYGAHQYDGGLNINAGSVEVKTDASFATVNAASALAITGGTTTITTYTGNSGSSLSVEQGASLTFNGTTQLAAQITNNGGLNFAAGSSLTLVGDFSHGNGAYLDLDTGLSSENGNGLQSGAYVVVSTGSGSYTVDGTVAVTYNGQQYTLQEDGKAYQAFNDSIYYVRSGTANYSQAVASTNSITQLNLIPNATLNLQTNLSSAVVHGDGIQASGGAVIIGEGVVLSRDSLHASAATTVNGSGTYSMDVAGGTSRGANVNFGADWHGTIRLYGEANQVLNLNDVARQDSAYAPIELAGVTASLTEGTIHPDLKLTDAVGGDLALTVKNADSFSFAGAVSGTGTMANDSNGDTTFAFSGADLADWTGAIQNSSGNLTVAISGMESGGTLGAALVGVNTVSYTGETDSDTYTVASLQSNDGGTVLTGTTGALEVESLTGSGDLTVNGSVKLSGGEYAGDSITVNSNATLHLNGVQAESAVLGGEGTISLESPQVTVAGVNGSGRIQGVGEDSHTLEIAGKGGESSAVIGSGVDLVMSGKGTQAFNGDVSEFNGAVDVLDGTLTFGNEINIGSLTMQGGEIGLEKGGSLGSVRVASGAEASINAAGGTIALEHAIMNSGILTLAGTIDASALSLETRDNGYIDVNQKTTPGGSGFATVQSAVEVVRNVVAGELNVEDAYVTRNGQKVKLSADGWARFESGADTHYDTYYLRDNDITGLSVSAIKEAASQGSAELNKIVFDNMETPVNLVVDTTTDLSLFKVNEDCTANLNLAESGRINLPSGYRGVEGFVKLGGEGTYSITNTTSLGKGVSLDAANWQGTVVLSGTGNTLDLSSRCGLWTQQDGGGASTVQLDGWTSALTDGGWTTDANVELAGSGLTVQGEALAGETAPVYAFNGNVSGTGNITNNRDGAATFTFADVAGWEGSFVGAAGETTVLFDNVDVAASIHANGGNVVAQFTKDDFEHLSMSGEMQKHGGSRLDVALLSGFVNFTNAADISSLLLGEGTTAIIQSNFTAENISGSGSIMVDDGILTVTEGIDSLAFTIYNAGTVAFSDNGTIVNLASDGNFDETTSSYRDINDIITEKGNGFHIGGNVQIISNGGVGSITGAENVTVNYKGTAYQLLSTGELYNADDSKTYYIHTGTVNYSSVKDAEGLVGLHLDNTLKPDSSATLSLDENLAETVTNGIVSEGGIINIGQGVTLAASALHAEGDTKLSGQGTYDLGSGVTAFAEHVSLASDWSGIVRISDAYMSPFTLSNYANNHSSVEVLGISGWWNTGVRDFNGKLILGKDDEHPEKVALKLTDASSNYTYTLNGGVSGQGDYMLAYDSSKRISATTHTIKGDVSSWTGAFIDAVAQTNAAHTATLRFENNTAVNGVVNIAANVQDERSGREDHVFNVEVVANQGNVHMTGNIEGIDKLTYDAVSSGRTLTIDNLETNDNGTTVEIAKKAYTGSVVINNLTGTGDLVLDNKANATGLASFELAGGNYEGKTLQFTAVNTDSHSGERAALLAISDGDLLANTKLFVAAYPNPQSGAAANVGIGINAATVKVGGIQDFVEGSNRTYNIVSGKPFSSGAFGFESDGTVRTLEITGAGGESVAGIGSHLNITMNGSSPEASQSFSGDMSAFNGDIDVKVGTISFTNPGFGGMMLQAVTVAEGASLNIGTAEEVGYIGASRTIDNKGDLSLSGIVSLNAVDRANFTQAKAGVEGFDGQGEYEGSGYLTTTTEYYLVDGSENSVLNASLQFEGATRVTDGYSGNDIVFTFNNPEGRTGTYYVNSNLEYNHDEMQGATSFIVKENTTLGATDGTVLNGVEIVKDGPGSMVVGTNLALTTAATASENNTKIAVIGGELRIQTANTTVDGARLISTGGGEQAGTVAFTKLFKGEAVSVTDGGKLVLEGNINATDQSTGIGSVASGVANLEVEGSVTINAWSAATYSLGDHNMKVTGDFWLTNKQDLSVAGGSLEVGQSLKLGHAENDGNGNYRAHVTAAIGSNVKLHDIQFNGGANAVSIEGSTVTFTQEETNVLSHANTAASTANTVTLTGDKLVAQDNSWNLTALTGNDLSTVAVSGNTTLDIASGKSITLGGANVSGSIDFGISAGTLVLQDTAQWAGSVNITENGTLSIAGTSAAAGSAAITNGGILDLTGATSQVTLGSLAMNDGGTLKLDAENLLSTSGAISLGSNSTLDLSSLDLSSGKASYVLASGGSITMGENITLTLSNPEYEGKASLYAGNGNLVLLLDLGSKDLVWKGPNGNWSIDPAAVNWYIEGTDVESGFADGDTVRFGAASNGHTATLGSNVSPAGVTVNENASATVNLSGHTLTADHVTVASGSTLAVCGSTGSFTNTGALSLDNSKLSINNGGAEVSLGNVTMANGATLEVLAAKDTEAKSVFVDDGSDATIKLGADMTIAASGGTEPTAGALYTMGAEHTLQIVGVGETVHTLTVDKFDIANVNTGVSLQNVNLVVKGAATVGELSVRSNNHGTVSVDGSSTMTFNGSVDWNHDGKYVDLDISGTVNVNGGATNKLHDVTLNGNGDINFAQNTATTIEGALSLAKTIDNSGSLTLSGTVTLTGSLTEDYDFAEKVTGYSGQGEYAGSGYEVDATNYYLVKNSGTGTLSSTATSSDASVILSVKDNSLLFHTAGQQGTVYYINKDLTYNADEMGAATAIHVSENKTLTGTMAEVTAKHFAGTGKVVVSNDIGDGTLTFNGVTEGFDGTLSLTRAAGNHNKKLVLNNFNGTLEYAGRFELNGSDLGEAKQITFNGDRSSSNTGLWFHGNGAQELTQDIELIGDNDVQFEITDNNTNLVVSGDVSGNKLWKTGVGKMTLDGGVNVTRAKISGGSLVFNDKSTIGTYMITGGTTNFNADTTITTLGTESGSINATVTIGEDAKVNVTNIANNWGIGTMTVNGVLNVEETFLFSTGNDRNTVNGTGIINTNKVTSQNVTNPAAFSGVTLNIGSGGIDGGQPVEFGTMTVGVREGADGWTADNNNISLASGATTTFAPGANQSITMGNIGGTGSLVMNGEGALNFNGTVSYTGTTTVETGTLNLGGNSHSMSILNVNGGKVTTTHSGGSGCVSGTININAGGTFEVAGQHDAFGYDDNVATAKIAMAGTEGNVARLVLNPSNHGSVTMKTNLELNGNAVIEAQNGAAFNTFGCKIAVSNTGNTISGMQVRNDVTIGTAENAELTLKSLAQSTIAGSSGTLTKDGAGTLILDAASITNTASIVSAGTLVLTDTVKSITGALAVNSGAILEFANNVTLSGKVSGEGVISFKGADNTNLTMNGNVTEFTGALQNESDADLTLSLGTSANHLYMDISSTGKGNVDLSMGGGDYFLYGTQNVRNITQPVSVHMEVKGQGNVTATGTVQTGNFDVGTTSDETGARFSLSGQDAKLIYSGDAHSYSANVRGYGTFAVVDGATQELTNIGSFHGIFEAEGEGSVLTLSGTLGNGTRLHASNDGVIILKQTYTLDDNVTVDDGTLRVDNGLVVNGSVDLSKGTLTQTGGTVTVNADKSLTLGDASITSAISNGGTVAFTKDITATGLVQESSDDVYVGADDEKTATANHFDGTRTESAIRVVSGGTVDPAGHKVTQGDVDYTIQQDGTAVGVTESNVDYASFLQHEAGSTLKASTITGTAAQHKVYVVVVDVNKATLNVDSALMAVEATNANIINTANEDNIQFLQIEGGSNNLTGSVDDLASMTQFAQGVESSLHIQGAETAQKAGAVVFHGAESERDVTITAAQVAGDSSELFSLENARYTVESHKMVKVENGNVTVNNHIKTDTVSTGETTGSLTLANGVDAEALNEVLAASGDVTFLNMAAENKTTGGSQTAVSLNNLEIGAGKTVSFYEAAAPVNVGELAEEASVTVVGMLTAGEGATLNADLHMKSGSVMDVSGAQASFGLQLGSAFTIDPGAQLSDADMLAVSSLSMENRWYYLATSAEQLFITGIGEWNGTKGEQLTCEDYMHVQMDAANVYTNLDKNRYALVYNWGQNVGTYTVALYLIPEPATTSLSLLALAALAARRRRK